jgi:hypothetical protein
MNNPKIDAFVNAALLVFLGSLLYAPLRALMLSGLQHGLPALGVFAVFWVGCYRPAWLLTPSGWVIGWLLFWFIGRALFSLLGNNTWVFFLTMILTSVACIVGMVLLWQTTEFAAKRSRRVEGFLQRNNLLGRGSDKS